MPVTISCPSSLTVNTGFNGADHCTGLAPDLFAAIVPESPYTYSTTGATVSSGSQSAGALFNLGLTTVTYTSVNDPSKSCSFTVTVVDSRAPTLNCTGEIRPCYSANQMYTIPPHLRYRQLRIVIRSICYHRGNQPFRLWCKCFRIVQYRNQHHHMDCYRCIGQQQ